MKKLSKMLSVVLSLAMCAGMVAPAFAASFTELQGAINTGNSVYQEDGKTYKIEASKDDTGAVNIKLHEKVTNAEGGAVQVNVNNQNVTIDLNGNRIVDEKSKNQAVYVYGTNASLTVTDSSKEKTGTIESSTGIQVITNQSGTLNLEGGTIKSDGTSAITNKGTLNLNGGAVEGNGSYGINNQNGTLNLESGTVKADGEKGVAVNTNGTTGKVTISENVTVEGGKTGAQVLGGSSLETNGSISGGRNGILAQGQDSSVTVTGGSVEGVSTNGIYLAQGATATVDGADTTVKGGKSGITVYDNATALTVNDGTVEGGSYGIMGNGQYHGTDIKVLGGNVTGGSTGIYHPQDGTLTIGKEDGTGPVITGVSGNGVQLCAGEAIIYGGTIQGSGEDRTADKAKDGVIPDGSAVSAVSRDGYGSGNIRGVYSEPKVTIHADHVNLIGGEATYQWANTEDPGNKPENWTGDDKTSGIFEVTHHDDLKSDPYYTDDFVVIDPRIEPTDTEPGWTEGSHCKVCGHVFVPQTPIWPDTPSTPPDPVIDPTVEIEDVDVPLAGLFTRADAIGYLWEKTGSPDWELSDFPDVPEDHYWAVAIGWAQDMGIAVADKDGNFRPDDLVLCSVESLEISPEGELQEFLNRYAVYAGIELDEGELFIELAGAWDDVIMGEEAQVIFDEFFAKLEAALAQAA